MKTSIKVLALIFCFVFAFSATADAEIKTIEADGVHVMSNDESPAEAKERAHEEAIRYAGEQVSIYIQSLSEVRNGHLTQDVIRTVSMSVLQIQSIDFNVETAEDDRLIVKCHVVASVDSELILEKLREEISEAADAD